MLLQRLYEYAFILLLLFKYQHSVFQALFHFIFKFRTIITLKSLGIFEYATLCNAKIKAAVLQERQG